MKILVSVKRVLDFKAQARIKPDGSAVDLTHAKLSMNPFDEIAVEEAMRLKEKNLAQEVIAVSIGQDACQETLRTALAMGADRGILIKTDLNVTPLAAARILKHLALQEKTNLILLGKQAIDSDNNQVGQMLAALLDWSLATFASHVNVRDEGVSVTREIDGGLETLFLKLPAVITTDLRLNQPRYLSLPNIMKAKQKKIEVVDAASLNLDLTAKETLIRVAAPNKIRKKIRVTSVAELVDKLQHEAKVI